MKADYAPKPPPPARPVVTAEPSGDRNKDIDNFKAFLIRQLEESAGAVREPADVIIDKGGLGEFFYVDVEGQEVWAIRVSKAL